MSAPWFLLFGGSSADGLGPGVFVGRTTVPAEAAALARGEKVNNSLLPARSKAIPSISTHRLCKAKSIR